MPDTTTQQSGTATPESGSNTTTPPANGTGESGKNPSAANPTENKSTTTNSSSSSSSSSTSSSSSNSTKSSSSSSSSTTTSSSGMISKEGVPAVDSLIDGYSKLDNRKDAFQTFNAKEQYQIDIYLVPNFLNDSSRFTNASAIYLKWLSDVKQLSLRERLFQFGMSGSAVVVDNFGNLSHVLEQFITYDFVIDIMLKVNDKATMRFEPYIMSIVSIEELDWKNDGSRTLEIKFEDILTAEAKRHSIGTLLKYNTDLKKTPSFPELYEKIYNYLSNLIYENTNHAMTYGKKVKFKKYEANDVSSLVKIIFDNIDPAKSIYDLLMAINKSACIAIHPDSSVTKGFEMIGDVLTPLFFQEEYPDLINYYYQIHMEPELEDFKTKRGGGEDIYIPRPFTTRSFYSPFVGAFIGKNGIVFESFTTSDTKDTEASIVTLTGSDPMPIRNFQSLTTNSNYTINRWKNIAFISSNPHGGSNRLVFFNWIFEFFNQAFLQNKLNKTNIKLSNVLPNFYLAHQGNDTLLNDKDLSEKNTNIIMLQNEKDDPKQEILMQVGKSMASLVFLNNLYSFEVEGNMFRRPNEIVNVYTPHSTKAVAASQPIRTDLMRTDNVMLYVSEVVHNFDTNTFYDKLICNRIYEQIPAKAASSSSSSSKKSK